METCMSFVAATRAAAVGAVLALGSASVPTDPPMFSRPLAITNRYDPFVPGRVKRYETQQGHTDAEDVDRCTTETRVFRWNGQDVACRVLEEESLEDGVRIEISRNYFAQADDGAVYYFGEVVDLYRNGHVASHSGSWLVGGPGASDPPETANAPAPNVFMPARPEVGDVWKPEDLLPIVDESDLVVKTGVSVSTPVGRFGDCIEVRESSQLTPETESKWYVPGVGVVRVKEHAQRSVLVAIEDP